MKKRMEQLCEKWRFNKDCLRIETFSGWVIAVPCWCFPNDKDGSKTARYICDLHNKALKERSKT